EQRDKTLITAQRIPGVESRSGNHSFIFTFSKTLTSVGSAGVTGGSASVSSDATQTTTAWSTPPTRCRPAIVPAKQRTRLTSAPT
ncbi:MAG TPA: hypothetical protein VGC85_05035, partial [Chthoniobacterales bacterium]